MIAVIKDQDVLVTLVLECLEGSNFFLTQLVLFPIWYGAPKIDPRGCKKSIVKNIFDLYSLTQKTALKKPKKKKESNI